MRVKTVNLGVSMCLFPLDKGRLNLLLLLLLLHVLVKIKYIGNQEDWQNKAIYNIPNNPMNVANIHVGGINSRRVMIQSINWWETTIKCVLVVGCRETRGTRRAVKYLINM